MYQDRRSLVNNPPLSAEDFDRNDMGALGDTESCTRDRTAIIVRLMNDSSCAARG